MLIGHYAPALALKAARPAVPLWALFVAVQLVDIAWALFVLGGVERAHLQPGFTPSNALVLDYMPFTHGLVSSLLWAGAAGGLATWLWRGRPDARRLGLTIGLAVLSHWLLDLPVHMADLPIFAGDGVKVGLGLWQYREVAFALELVLVLAGAALCIRRAPSPARAKRYRALAFVMATFTAASYFGPQPETMTAMTTTALGFYGLLAQLAAWVERAT